VAVPGPTKSFRQLGNTASVSPPIVPCTNPAGFNLLTGTGSLSTGFTASTNRGGWVIGFGPEFALTRSWSARAETDYTSFGDTNVTASDGSALRVGMHFWEEKIGLNYRF
jgi:opacity protein-like surface antigen